MAKKQEEKKHVERYVYQCIADCALALTDKKATGGFDSLPCFDRDGAGNSPNRLTIIETAVPLNEDWTRGKPMQGHAMGRRIPGTKRHEPGSARHHPHFRRLSDSEITELPAGQKIKLVSVRS